MRAPWFYGPHQPARQTLFFKMIQAGRLPILGDGSQRRSMAYVDNLCQGLLLAASVQQDWGLYELIPEQQSLEDLFIELTHTEEATAQ